MRTLFVVVAAVIGCTEAATPRSIPVGRQYRDLVDVERTAWSGQRPRPLAVSIWYPAAEGSIEAPFTVPTFSFGQSALDAAPRDSTPRPLIVLSHGTGGSMAQLSWLAEELATAGYIVAGVDHHGNTAAEDTMYPHGFVLPWERARDLSFLVDALRRDSVFAGLIDTARIGAGGFSLGGYTALALAGAHLDFASHRRACAALGPAPECTLPPEAGFTLATVDSLAAHDAPFQASVSRGVRDTRDGRIRAVFVLAPAGIPVLDSVSLAGIAIPLRVLLGGRDTQVEAARITPLIAQRLAGASVTTLPDAGHYAFLAECTLRGRVLLRQLCQDGGAKRANVHREAARAAVAFFDTAIAARTTGQRVSR